MPNDPNHQCKNASEEISHVPPLVIISSKRCTNRCMADQSDEEIARRVQKGDASAFAEIIARYEQKLMRYIKRFLHNYEDVEDTVQNVFIKTYENINSFHLEKRFSPWIYRIAHNTAITVIKKRAREAVPFFDPDTLFPHPVAKEQTNKLAEMNELSSALESCLSQLKPSYREPIILYFFEDMDYRQISDVMHIPITTVGVRINRAKKQLKQLYESKTE